MDTLYNKKLKLLNRNLKLSNTKYNELPVEKEYYTSDHNYRSNEKKAPKPKYSNKNNAKKLNAFEKYMLSKGGLYGLNKDEEDNALNQRKRIKEGPLNKEINKLYPGYFNQMAYYANVKQPTKLLNEFDELETNKNKNNKTMEDNIRRIQQQNERNKGVIINKEKVNAKKLMLMDMHKKREDKINTMDTLKDYDFNAKRLNHLGNYIELGNNRLDLYHDR